MHEELIGLITLVLVLGILAQWISWWLKLPSILLLLLIPFFRISRLLGRTHRFTIINRTHTSFLRCFFDGCTTAQHDQICQ